MLAALACEVGGMLDAASEVKSGRHSLVLIGRAILKIATMSAPQRALMLGESCLFAMLGVCAPLRLRPAVSADIDLYLWWANDPDVRRSSLQTELIQSSIATGFMLACLQIQF